MRGLPQRRKAVQQPPQATTSCSTSAATCTLRWPWSSYCCAVSAKRVCPQQRKKPSMLEGLVPASQLLARLRLPPFLHATFSVIFLASQPRKMIQSAAASHRTCASLSSNSAVASTATSSSLTRARGGRRCTRASMATRRPSKAPGARPASRLPAAALDPSLPHSVYVMRIHRHVQSCRRPA